MVKKYAGRYSRFLRPISILIDLIVVNSFIFLFFFYTEILLGKLTYVIFSFLWIISSLLTRFYEVYRFTKVLRIFTIIFYQFVLFTVLVFAYLGAIDSNEVNSFTVLFYITYCFIPIAGFKLLLYYGLQRYRLGFGGNFRKTIIIGNNDAVLELKDFFNKQKELGYENRKTFQFKSHNDFDIEACFTFILNNNIDEVYCSANELKKDQIKLLVLFCENNFKILKFISERGGILSKKLQSDTYGFSTVQSLRPMPLSNDYNSFIKRFFDIVFSFLVIVFILSWATPIIAFLIKIESKGPIFFKQTRNGIKYKEFTCLKFRSMFENKTADTQQATKNDVRVTRIGRFLRKTSIDELPQFFNVLMGDMSVVGPRPHMIKENEKYAKSIKKFMVRHFVKPGITGMAQVKGYRGEIETETDIINRVKYDIYYLENWTILLDLNIILLTSVNFLTGQKKAY